MPMKVTVCFDRVRVIVPCGDGDILVRQLIEKAVVRYKKATSKSNDYWVSVQNLRTINDGGILDPDDQLNDVVDDREQLIADYEEQGGQSYHPHNGDGASQSSAGTASPDIFQASELQNQYPANKNFSAYHHDDRHDVVVTPKDIEIGSGLTVRRGSEPALNVLGVENDGTQKEQNDFKQPQESSDPDDIEVEKQMGPAGDTTKNLVSRFSRDSWRQSLGNRPDMYKWLDAQEKQQDRMQQIERHEPVGGASTDQGKENNSDSSSKPDLHPPGSVMINLPNDGGPLGIHVVPDYSDNGREMGLLVQGVESGGRVFKDGRLKENDRIIEINGQTLVGVSFAKAQDIFRAAMRDNEILLRIVKKQAPPLPKQPPPPVFPKPRGHMPVKPSPLTLPISKLNDSDSLSPVGPEQTSTPNISVQNSSNASSPDGPPKSPISSRQNKDISPIKPAIPVKPPSPTKKVPPAVPTRHPTTVLSGQTERQILVAPTNTKKIGKKIEITLTKGPVGLGFSLTTRDNPAGGDSPIYIKNILPRGAAITDGKLKAGDRLLEVNDEDVSGKTQADVVDVLRNLTMGTSVTLVVSRQEVVDERFNVPRELKENESQQNVFQPPEKTGDDGTLADMKNKDVIRLEIPLNDSGSAGLGVSVKGKTLTTDQGTRDLGIFIKSVIHGGAASKDGRLSINDQLIQVNGAVLTGVSNTDAMEMLRKAMQVDGPVPGHIHLVIARKLGAPSPSPFQQDTSSSTFSFSNGPQPKFENDGDSKEMILTYSPKKIEPLKENNENRLEKSKTPPPLPPHKPRALDYLDGGKARNFLIERLTGQDSALRNESYSRATHDSFNDSAAFPDTDGNGFRNDSYNIALGGNGNLLSPGISPIKLSKRNLPNVATQRGDAVIIENDSMQPRVRPHSTIGFLHHSPPHSNSSSSEDLQGQPVWLQGADWNTNRHESTTSEEFSPLGDPFRREGFGRQSMSEKRKGHVDPSKSEVYQRVKNQRDSQRGASDARRAASFHVTGYGRGATSNLIRVGSAESLISRNSKSYTRLPPLPVHGKARRPPPPPTNLKRFNSLENLAQVTPADTDTSKESFELSHDSQDLEEGHSTQQVRLGRGRGCNESFRAAVDRSYDPVPSEHANTMDTLEEESSESGSYSQGGFPNSARSSVSSENTTEDPPHKKGRKKGKEMKVGILKGLLKFGKSKKTTDESSSKPENTDEVEKNQFNDRGLRSSHREQDRIQEQMRQLQEKQQAVEQLRRQQNQQMRQHTNMADDRKNQINQSDVNVTSMSRAEWIQHLRAEHQRRHQERQGQYPLDDKEEYYEQEIQDDETRVWLPNQYPYERYGKSAIPDNILHGNKSHSTSHLQYERPHSRPSYPDNIPTHHSNFQHYGNIVHPRQHSNEYSSSRQHGIEHFHQRQNSDISEQFSQDYYARRPPSRSHTPTKHWQEGGSISHPAFHRQSPFPQPHPQPPGAGHYGDAVYAYRDPIYPAVAGKRPVQTLTQPGSAKV